MITLYNYINDHKTENIDYFVKEIGKKTVPVLILDNLSFSISLIISAGINRKRDVIINKM